MSFFKTLFGGGNSQTDDSKDTVKRDFDVLKYDGVRAPGQGMPTMRCNALNMHSR